MSKTRLERAVVEINGGCNYSCQMCPQSAPDGRGKTWLKKLPLERFERLMEELSSEHDCKVINLEGSGEPTLNANLHEYVSLVKKYGMKAYAFSNGFRMRGDLMRRSVDAGLDFFRFSVIGYNAETYWAWMNSRNFDQVMDNIESMQKYSNGSTTVASYHLIMDNDNIEYEVDQYRKNVIDKFGIKGEIWRMHNWSGVYESANDIRKGEIKTCGRPFAPEIVIRAGGEFPGAVHPCCQVLGRDDEAVLGYTSENLIQEILDGVRYQELREGHLTGNYPKYCKGCDFLIDDPEVLVYSNHANGLHSMHGTDINLREFTN